MPNFKFLAGWFLLAVCAAMIVPATASADGYTVSTKCDNAFNFGDSFPSQRVVLVPSVVRAGAPATVCVFDFVYVSHVDVTQDRQHLTVTLYDTGFSWSPNPPIVVSGELPSLTAGSYTMDVVVAAGFDDQGLYYPYSIAANIPVTVAGAALVEPLPTLSAIGFGAAMLMLGLAGVIHMRRTSAVGNGSGKSESRLNRR